MNTIAHRIDLVKARILNAERASGRAEGSVSLLAVSKTRPPAEIAALHACGQRAFGESYVPEAVEKMAHLAGLPIEWHFIGPLQANKTRSVAAHFDWVHSVGRLKIARRLSEQRPEELGPLNICLQVNISGEATKSGALPDEAADLAAEIAALPRLRLRGLMAIPAPADAPAAKRAPLRALCELQARLTAGGLQLDTLSMGMSDDLEEAIAEGSTMVRIGIALFGPRAAR